MLNFLSTYYIYYKYYKIFPRKFFSKEHVYVTLWPLLENFSSGKLNRCRRTVKTFNGRRSINLSVLNRENIICEIKSLICIHETPSMKLAIFNTQFAKVSSLEIFSHKNIFSKGIINLTNGKGSYTQKHQKRYLIFAFSARYLGRS